MKRDNSEDNRKKEENTHTIDQPAIIHVQMFDSIPCLGHFKQPILMKEGKLKCRNFGSK